MGDSDGMHPEPITPMPPPRPGGPSSARAGGSSRSCTGRSSPARSRRCCRPGSGRTCSTGRRRGLLAFRMVGRRRAGQPGVPYLGSFAETNVRLYSVDDEAAGAGSSSCSLDADPAGAGAGRAGAGPLPYPWSRIRWTGGGDARTTGCGGAGPGRAGGRQLAVRVGERLADPPPLDLFVTARWRLHLAARAPATALAGGARRVAAAPGRPAAPRRRPGRRHRPAGPPARRPACSGPPACPSASAPAAPSSVERSRLKDREHVVGVPPTDDALPGRVAP